MKRCVNMEFTLSLSVVQRLTANRSRSTGSTNCMVTLSRQTCGPRSRSCKRKRCSASCHLPKAEDARQPCDRLRWLQRLGDVRVRRAPTCEGNAGDGSAVRSWHHRHGVRQGLRKLGEKGRLIRKSMLQHHSTETQYRIEPSASTVVSRSRKLIQRTLKEMVEGLGSVGATDVE